MHIIYNNYNKYYLQGMNKNIVDNSDQKWHSGKYFTLDPCLKIYYFIIFHEKHIFLRYCLGWHDLTTKIMEKSFLPHVVRLCLRSNLVPGYHRRRTRFWFSLITWIINLNKKEPDKIIQAIRNRQNNKLNSSSITQASRLS